MTSGGKLQNFLCEQQAPHMLLGTKSKLQEQSAAHMHPVVLFSNSLVFFIDTLSAIFAGFPMPRESSLEPHIKAHPDSLLLQQESQRACLPFPHQGTETNKGYSNNAR